MATTSDCNTICLSHEGVVYSFGKNTYGQKKEDQTIPKPAQIFQK